MSQLKIKYRQTLNTQHFVTVIQDGFGGLVVSIFISMLAGSNPVEAVEFFGRPENPQHAFLRRGSKRIFPMSQLCGM